MLTLRRRPDQRLAAGIEPGSSGLTARRRSLEVQRPTVIAGRRSDVEADVQDVAVRGRRTSCPRAAACPASTTSACEPASTRSCQSTTSQRMNPRAMSEWIDSAASSAVSPWRSVQARVSFSPAVKNVIRSSASRSRPATSSSADAPPSRIGGRLVLGELGQLRLELQVDPARAVLDRDQRLRRQRLELRRQLAGVVDQRAARVDVREHLAAAPPPRPAASRRPTSPASRRARAGARRGRGRRRAARA